MTYTEWEFPQPKWLWDYNRIVKYREKIENHRKSLYDQRQELVIRNNELKLILFDAPDNQPAKNEMGVINRASSLIDVMLNENNITLNVLDAVLGKLDHNEAFMKWRYNWTEDGICTGLRDVSEEQV